MNAVFSCPDEEAQTDPAQIENVITLNLPNPLINRNTSIESNFRVSGDR